MEFLYKNKIFEDRKVKIEKKIENESCSEKSYYIDRY
jgi:hypothetical protein